MSLKNDKWVRRFLVTDPTLHEKQFTIYKITSIVFPRGMPEASTKVVIWKRYSDFKKLHDEMKLLCKSLKIQDFPRLEKSTFFKRFDPQVIENRCKTALRLLEFIADHSLLFTSDMFTKFLQTSNFVDTAPSSASGPPHYEPTEPKSFNVNKHANDCLSYCSTDSRSSSAVDTDSAICSSVLSVDVPYIDSVSPNLSSSKIDSKDSNSSKLSADSLLSNPVFESVPSQMVFDDSTNGKYRMLLSINCADRKLGETQDLIDPNAMCRISFCQQDLRRYHIIGILKHLMYVQDKVSKQFCVIKGVPKSVEAGPCNQINILPQYSKNMIRLYHAVETESSLYLVLEYVKHVKLWDHLSKYFNEKSHGKDLSSSSSSSNKLKSENPCGFSDNGAQLTGNDSNREDSYSALIRNYRANSRSISKSLLDVQTRVVECESAIERMTQNQMKVENGDNSNQSSHFIETGSKEEDNFNKLMRKIDLIMEDKEREVYSRSTPDVSKLTTASLNVAPMLSERLPEDNWSSFSEISNTVSGKFNGSLVSIDSINDNLDFTSPKFIDESDSSNKTEVEKFCFDTNSNDFNVIERTNVNYPRNDASVCVHAMDQIKSTNGISSDSDISAIKDSCYKVLSKIEAVLHRKSESQSPVEFNGGIYIDPTDKIQDDKIALASSETVDLIDKAQQLLDSVNETLQQCENKTNHHDSKLTKFSEHCSSFESVDDKKNLSELKVESARESRLNENRSLEMKFTEEVRSSWKDEKIETVNSCVDVTSRFKDTYDFSVDLTNDKKFKCLDDSGFCNVEHSSLSHQIVMNEESTFNFKFLFADPATVTADKIRQWAGQILLALENLHQRGILCWDLNPENILLNKDGSIKLTYFYRHSKVLPIWSRDALEGHYVAPELLTCPSASPDESQDWWSYGVLLFHLITGKSLSSHHPEGIYPHFSLNIPEAISAEASSFLFQLLKYEPQNRLGSGTRGVEEIKSHTYFNNFDWG